MSTVIASQPRATGLNIVIYQAVIPSLRELLSQGVMAGVLAYFLFIVVLSFFIPNYYKILFVGALHQFLAWGGAIGLVDGLAVWCCREFFELRLRLITRWVIAALTVAFAYGILTVLYPPKEPANESLWRIALWALVLVMSLGLITGSRLRPWRALSYGVRQINTHQEFPATAVGFLLRIALLFGCLESIFLFICIIEMNEEFLDLLVVFLVVAYFLIGITVAFANLKFWLTVSMAVVINTPWLFILVKHFNQMDFMWFFILGYVVLWCGYVLTRCAILKPVFSSLNDELKYYYLID